MRTNGFHLRWRSTTVSTQSIGQCSYACGENKGTAVYDPCKGRYTKIIWRNEEGRRGYNHLGSICDYSAPAGADVDVYCFEPESNRLTIEHFRRLITWGGWSRGTDQSEGIYYDAPAPTDDTGLCDNRKHQLSRPLGLIALEMTGSGGTDGPARTRLLAFNNAPDGQIQATIAGENLSIPLQAGLSPTAVLARVIEAINTHPRLAAWQITALAVSEPVTAPAEMDIIGVSEDAARFRVPATGPSQFILMTPWDAPRLSSSIQNGVLLLSCPRWPIVSSCSKEPLMGQPSTGTS